ncbi:MAG: glucose-6-phosphate isomerase [Betaproteobacteria bacterium RIFCSPLOWO2_12_FULL_68_20]|nr:MAG: glucose-6-phosphate isomerase [Betaproteobacteria bacterium RIFCSPLOWO2_12_FULL_68_20]
MNTTSPTQCRAWSRLSAQAAESASIAQLFAADPSRAQSLVAEAPGVRYDYSRQRLDAPTLELLCELAAERGLADWREALLAGATVNSTENRAAWHTALRAGDAAPAEVKKTLRAMSDLAGRIRSDGKLRRIVNLGIGGSDLGPRLVADALADGAIDVRFAANVDPLDLERSLEGADPAATLFVVVSKTFTTQETMANAQAAKRWSGGRSRFIAVTSNVELAGGFGAAEVLPMWDWVGGRFSVWSAAGFSAMCALGPERFDELLAGAAEIDRHFAAAPLQRNVPALMALAGVWNVNFLGAATHAVLPYATALRLLPAYLQQLEMESNGKRVDREGRPVSYATAPVLWGAEGTTSQHSFHQLLHQGTQVVPADFIEAGRGEILAAHARAQADALAFGRDDPQLPAHRRYPGNRPSSTLHLERLDARGLGHLLALYEHKVFAQGVIWNINSFDQWGVELGKELAKRILSRR